MKVLKSLTLAATAALATLPPTPASAQQASFDCAKAGTPAEHLICADKELGALDIRTASAFSTARNAPGADKPALLQQQRDWLKRRTSACGIPDSGRKPDGPQVQPWSVCLADQYRQRLAQLGQAPEQTAGSPAVPATTPGPSGGPPAPTPALQVAAGMPSCDTLSSIYSFTAETIAGAGPQMGNLAKPLPEWNAADFDALFEAYVSCRNKSPNFLRNRYPSSDTRYFAEAIRDDIKALRRSQEQLQQKIAARQAAEEKQRKEQQAASAQADRERVITAEYEDIIRTLSQLTVDSEEAVQRVRALETRYRKELRPQPHSTALWQKSHDVDEALNKRLADIGKFEKAAALRARNAEAVDPRVNALGLPKAMLEAKLFLSPYLGGNFEEWGRMDVWLSRVLNNQKLKGPVQSIEYRELQDGIAKGISIKVAGTPTVVILFNLDGGELFPSWVGNNDRVDRLWSALDQANLGANMRVLAGDQ